MQTIESQTFVTTLEVYNVDPYLLSVHAGLNPECGDLMVLIDASNQEPAILSRQTLRRLQCTPLPLSIIAVHISVQLECA